MMKLELKRIRDISDYTQEEIAKFFKKSSRTIQNWEAKGEIPEEMRNKIVGLLNNYLEEGKLTISASDEEIDKAVFEIEKLILEKRAEQYRSKTLTAKNKVPTLINKLLDQDFLSQNQKLAWSILHDVYNDVLAIYKGDHKFFSEAISTRGSMVENVLSGTEFITKRIIINCYAAFRECFESAIRHYENEINRNYDELCYKRDYPVKGTIAVPIKAQANYSKNIVDPVFLRQLERFYLPNNPYDGDNFRFFQMEGDSMEYMDEFGKVTGLPDGGWVIGEYVPKEDWSYSLHKGAVYIVVTDSRITIKRILQDNNYEIVLHADNEIYGQERLPLKEVKEIWLFKRYLDWNAQPPRNIQIKV